MVHSFSIHWWFPDCKQDGYLKETTYIFSNLVSLRKRQHSEGFFIRNLKGAFNFPCRFWCTR